MTPASPALSLKLDPRRCFSRLMLVLAGGTALLLSACDSSLAPMPTIAPAPPAHHALGGTISGLNAAGLVLANAGVALTVDSGAVQFSFGAVLVAGDAYAVSIQTQPAGESCTVANGAGTDQDTDVANVVVTCSPIASNLGGTIHGLPVAGLVLANGSDRLSVPANATEFTMPAAVAAGSGYAVTVATQPGGLACAVSHGTGTMPAQSVTSVAVTCTDQPFNVGGTVAGLTTAGLVLANGTDTLTVSASATHFTMPMPVPFSGTYAVSVRTQPTGLACAVSHGAGTMGAGDVTNIAITCADRSFGLSGTVSGLTSSGLVLANGNDSVNVPASAGGFAMSAVPYAAAYSVMVQAQPAGLTCTVSNGAGTMPANDIMNVSVVCAPDSYTVGGSITGLTASGLTLQNGSDTLSVSANAALFSMPMPVASGSAYAVGVQTQPSGELCSIANGSGTVTTADITSVQVSCHSDVYSFTTVGAATWTVPAGVTSIQVVATGGGGGGGGSDSGAAGSTGGNGGIVTVTFTVAPGDVVDLFVGGGGAAGGFGASNGFGGGGGGGGSSNVSVNGVVQIVAGAGGGGFGYVGSGEGYGGNGNGGDADTGGSACGGFGGANGVGGLDGDTCPFFMGSPTGGGNGSGGAGGAGGANGSIIAGGAGGAGSGGGTGSTASNANFGGAAGGGGGGYGGGGAGGPSGGGGGGGSTGPGTSVYTLSTNGGASATAGGDGSIVITVYP